MTSMIGYERRRPLWYTPGKMKLSRRQSTVLLVMGVIMLFFWITRAYTWYANDLQANPYLAFVHLPIIFISLAIGGYLTYLGIRGRRAAGR